MYFFNSTVITMAKILLSLGNSESKRVKELCKTEDFRHLEIHLLHLKVVYL